VEALLRWNHPDQGLLGPASFLAVAEQAGLMGHLGRWVLAESCAQARSWLDDGLPVHRIAVNLSAQEFLRHDVVSLVESTLARTGVPADVLEIEITEGVALQSLDNVLATLTSLRALGVRIAIDDFGTGYSSMSYLQRFPIQTLKIDRSFMSRVADDEHSAAIASMLVDLCTQLSLDIVAEGIEHEAQRTFLAERGCITAQGNLFCEPLRADEITRVLRSGLVAKIA
jgi:EAL domain-containing protein (putative c-di-GMP-specific phosphodiesterase class I)